MSLSSNNPIEKISGAEKKEQIRLKKQHDSKHALRKAIYGHSFYRTQKNLILIERSVADEITTGGPSALFCRS